MFSGVSLRQREQVKSDFSSCLAGGVQTAAAAATERVLKWAG
jgi:hypothetical protein